jgi:hypothetical protein
MKDNWISPAEYAKLSDCSPQYIHRLLLAGDKKKLPHIKEIKRFSRFYTLRVPAGLRKKDFKKQ